MCLFNSEALEMEGHFFPHNPSITDSTASSPELAERYLGGNMGTKVPWYMLKFHRPRQSTDLPYCSEQQGSSGSKC